MRWLAKVSATLLVSLPLLAAAGPVGTWKVDPLSLEAVAERMAGAMAAQVTPEDLAAMRSFTNEMQAQIEALRASNPALAAQMEEMMGGMAGMGDDPAAGIRDMMSGVLAEHAADAAFTFASDGEVTIEDPDGAGPDPLRWRWRMDGGEVEIIGTDPEDPSGTYVLRGPLDGDRMTLRLVVTDTMRAEMADEPGLAEMMGTLEYVLLRQ